jgi:hypothetical protein
MPTRDATAISNTSAENGETEIVNILEAIPAGSAITFRISNLEDYLAGAPIVSGTDCRKVERLAQARNCSFILHENAGTITFYSNEDQDALGVESDELASYRFPKAWPADREQRARIIGAD